MLVFEQYNFSSNQCISANGGSLKDHYYCHNMPQLGWPGLNYISLLSLLIGEQFDGQTSILLSLEKEHKGVGYLLLQQNKD